MRSHLRELDQVSALKHFDGFWWFLLYKKIIGLQAAVLALETGVGPSVDPDAIQVVQVGRLGARLYLILARDELRLNDGRGGGSPCRVDSQRHLSALNVVWLVDADCVQVCVNHRRCSDIDGCHN